MDRGSPLRCTANEELISTWRKLTTNVVKMIAVADAPAERIETAMNYALPANTKADIKPICRGDNPAFWAKTPNASPMGI